MSFPLEEDPSGLDNISFYLEYNLTLRNISENKGNILMHITPNKISPSKVKQSKYIDFDRHENISLK